MTVLQPSSSSSSSAKTPDETAEASTSSMSASVSLSSLVSSFPLSKLQKLEELISNPRWVIPVLPKAELETLLDACIALATHNNADNEVEGCKRFYYRDGLVISFTKIMSDEAVASWRPDIHRCIQRNCEKLMQLCVLKINDDNFVLLDLLGLVLDPFNKFHVQVAGRNCELTASVGNISNDTKESNKEDNLDIADQSDQIFAQPLDSRQPRGWLVDLLNIFGRLGGFDALKKRFLSASKGALNVSLIYALLKPFGQCAELLTQQTLDHFLMPIVKEVPAFLDSLSDESLKKESKIDVKNNNDALADIARYLRLIAQAANDVKMGRELATFVFKMLLRQLKVSSFAGKMNALNRVNKVIAAVSSTNTAGSSSSFYNSSRMGNLGSSESEQSEQMMSSDQLATWLQSNRVLQIALQDSLHQPQYVDKLEKVVRFLIKENALTLSDLDDIWTAQNGQHEAIVKNVHELLAKLAWDFSPPQLDHLFDHCFQTSWSTAAKSSKQREKLLELIRRLAEDDKDGVMAEKVLTLFWNLAHNPNTPNELLDQALTAHVKILDYSCTQNKDEQRQRWLEKCINELKTNKYWVVPALIHIRNICCLYPEAPNGLQSDGANNNNSLFNAKGGPNILYRHDVINNLQSVHILVIVVTDNLCEYVDEMRRSPAKVLNSDPAEVLPDNRFNHSQQVQERLAFLRFLLRDGQLWLCSAQAKQIWRCLAEQAVFSEDREAAFDWFTKLMSDEPDLDPDIIKEFFESILLKFDCSLVTESGIRCFERFFKTVNCKEDKLIHHRHCFLMDDLELIGLDYIWRLIMNTNDDIACKAIELLKETFTNLGPKLVDKQLIIHQDFIASCMDRLKALFDNVSILQEESNDCHLNLELSRLCRVLLVLKEYVLACDSDFVNDQRTLVPLHRACRGRQVIVTVVLAGTQRQQQNNNANTAEEFDQMHTNDTLGAVRRSLLQRLSKLGSQQQQPLKLELYYNGDLVDPHFDDKKTLGSVGISDKALFTAKVGSGTVPGAVVSSPDSSSDSSNSSPRHSAHRGDLDVLTVEAAERCLPGVLISSQPNFMRFLLQLADLGVSLNHVQLQNGARTLLALVPADTHTVEALKEICATHSATKKSAIQIWDSMFFGSSPSATLYHLEVCYSLLMPSSSSQHTEKNTADFQSAFVRAKGITCCISMLTRNNFLSDGLSDSSTKRSAYFVLFRMCKLLFTIAGHAFVQMVINACQESGNISNVGVSTQVHNRAALLQQALTFIPAVETEAYLRKVATKRGQEAVNVAPNQLPDHNTVMAILKIVWASASGKVDMATEAGSLKGLKEALKDQSTKTDTAELGTVMDNTLDEEDIALCREALEVLSLSMALHPSSLEILCKETLFSEFVLMVILRSNVRDIRVCASNQLLHMASFCSESTLHLRFFLDLLFKVLHSEVETNLAKQSGEYFSLLTRLVQFVSSKNEVILSNVDKLIQNEITWLKRAMECRESLEENLLQGHLTLCRDLLAFLFPDKLYEVGSSENGPRLVQHLLQDFLLPASFAFKTYRTTGDIGQKEKTAICSSHGSAIAGFDLVVALVTGSVANLKVVSESIAQMFFDSNDDHSTSLQDWEYLPPIGPRPDNGFVGLKNAGATCYMNSVLQQLFMIRSLREGVLSATETCDDDPDEDFSGEDNSVNDNNLVVSTGANINNEKGGGSNSSRSNNYNIVILKHVQSIFAHLLKSKLQFYVPRGLWRHFRMFQEPLNLREQQDAVEFFMRLVDILDEGLKTLGHEQTVTRVLGGQFSDQKICKTCPHRYSREQPFSVLSVDIRNTSTLNESLHEYVKGELLDGSNAYYCERCDKKVDTIKRLCVKKLPNVLVIQLKRFDYDYERECAIKFNDYFEFPRKLDMEPFTAAGLARIDNELIDFDDSDDNSDEKKASTHYVLRGIVVHSGQASGGHYYSFIRCRNSSKEKNGNNDLKNNSEKNEFVWYKFEDPEVTEVKLEDEEELKAQCYGGEYVSEAYDPMLKRMSYRKQKRWWNAYMLFYERTDIEDNVRKAESQETKSVEKQMEDLSLSPSLQVAMPAAIERSIRKQNMRFVHQRIEYSPVFFAFLRKLIAANIGHVQQSNTEVSPIERDQLALLTMQLASKVFLSVMRTKKSLRGAALEWNEAITPYLKCSKETRVWFCKLFLENCQQFSKYMFECPSGEVRNAFMRIVIALAHLSYDDGPASPSSFIISQRQRAKGIVANVTTISDYVLQTALLLLWTNVIDNNNVNRHVGQFFALFATYAALGPREKRQLIKLNLPAIFMQVALDEGVKYQMSELSKLYHVVSQLVRCCDVSQFCLSFADANKSNDNDSEDKETENNVKTSPSSALAPNPFLEPLLSESNDSASALPSLSPLATELLFSRHGYVKKVIEEATMGDDTRKLLQFCSWENPAFSQAVLQELLWQIAVVYTHELRPYIDLMLTILLIPDSWQTVRIQKALRGFADEQTSKGGGLLETISRSKTHYQKRGYQCIKMLVALFGQSPVAKQLLDTDKELRRDFTEAVHWLGEELERGNTGNTANNVGSGQYSYSNWSPPAQSNESVNGYFLERSNSARIVFDKASQLLPDDEDDNDEDEEDNDDDDDKKDEESDLQSQDSEQHRGGSK